MLTIPGYDVRPLGEADEAVIQRLSERCADYTEIVEGQPVAPDAGREFLTSAPEGWSPDRLLKLGVFDAAGTLVGVLDAAPGYPSDDVWWIGLLLLDPAARGGGLGRRIVAAFEQHAAARGARTIQLGVVADNAPGFRFWRARGYRDIETRPPTPMGRKVQSMTVMEKRLGG